MTLTDELRQFWLNIRQALLAQVDAIEVLLGMERTSDIRKWYRSTRSKNN
jgi:hypothetical protein